MDAEAQVAPRTRSLEVSAPFFRKLALASAISLYVIIWSGATVRLTGSGLGCEGWPGCSPGAVFPEQSYHSFIEFGNRVVSVFPILLSLATAVTAHFVRGLPRVGAGDRLGRGARHDRPGAARADHRAARPRSRGGDVALPARDRRARRRPWSSPSRPGATTAVPGRRSCRDGSRCSGCSSRR